MNPQTSFNSRNVRAALIESAWLWSALLLLFTLLLSGCAPAAEIEPAELFEVAVFSTQPASGAEFDIYSLNDADDSPKRLTTDPGTDWFPRLSPNGERVLYISSRSGRAEIWVMNADGSSQKRLTELGGISLAEYSPDGSTIAFIAGRDRRNELYLMDDDGANVRTLAPIERSVQSFAWSPDGSQIVFSASEGDDLFATCCDIFVVNADGTAEKRLTQTPYFEWWPQWSPDGAQIVFMSEWEDNTGIEFTSSWISPAICSSGRGIIFRWPIEPCQENCVRLAASMERDMASCCCSLFFL